MRAETVDAPEDEVCGPSGRERPRRLPLDSGAGIFEFLEGLLRRVVREEVAAAVHLADDWRDQSQSPILGSRRHCRAVRRRLAANPQDPSAKRVGDRFLLTPEAIAKELDLLGHKPDKRVTPKASTPEDEALARVQRRLRQVK